MARRTDLRPRTAGAPYAARVIKYLGSKRTLVPMLGEMAVAVGARTAVDLFTGTTRVAQELKRRGLHVTAADVASYSEVLSDCYVATDADRVDIAALDAELERLAALPGERGYVTETFCEQARFFQPKNGLRIDAVRAAIERDHPPGSPLRPILLTSLMLAADRVDSTTGIQMAYLKQWSPRSHADLELRRPVLLSGAGRTVAGDVLDTVDSVGPVDLAYVDPPYNQHRYFANYHIWETLVRWDAPEHYGVACKRVDTREQRSAFNSRRTMPAALADVLGRISAEVVIVSYNDESWMSADEMTAALRQAGHEEVAILGFDSKRYVGAKIGIHNRDGVRVGQVGRLRNVEYLFVAGPAEKVAAALNAGAPSLQR
ncbi:DNA adenine methylase [Nocardioides sp. zg-ZUI104]|uniref:DNA adenine methylase n=1 Tax=Nocardioides faecalis TaxID=2803858 RepID=UPI001BD147EE|nr:DNA adenine methylase [Nocardioides faecalis]MBS4751189.1 DNA adenine methylase [Nocardioides faecalis]